MADSRRHASCHSVSEAPCQKRGFCILIVDQMKGPTGLRFNCKSLRFTCNLLCNYIVDSEGEGSIFGLRFNCNRQKVLTPVKFCRVCAHLSFPESCQEACTTFCELGIGRTFQTSSEHHGFEVAPVLFFRCPVCVDAAWIARWTPVGGAGAPGAVLLDGSAGAPSDLSPSQNLSSLSWSPAR
jgi:hypothetical protein